MIGGTVVGGSKGRKADVAHAWVTDRPVVTWGGWGGRRGSEGPGPDVAETLDGWSVGRVRRTRARCGGDAGGSSVGAVVEDRGQMRQRRRNDEDQAAVMKNEGEWGKAIGVDRETKNDAKRSSRRVAPEMWGGGGAMQMWRGGSVGWWWRDAIVAGGKGEGAIGKGWVEERRS